MNKHQERRNARLYEQQSKLGKEVNQPFTQYYGDRSVEPEMALTMMRHQTAIRQVETLEWMNVNLSDLNETMAKIERHLDFIAGALTSGDR